MSAPDDHTESTAESPPLQPTRFPPSVGGSGLALVSGMLFARHTLEVTVYGGSLPMGAWVVPAVMLAFVFVLLRLTMATRRRMGAVLDPRSVRRQWVVIGVAFLMGIGGGVAFAMMEPRGVA